MKKNKANNINTQDYWNKRFYNIDSWRKNHYQDVYELYLYKYVNYKLLIADYGCSLADGIKYLSSKSSLWDFIGYDISNIAIEKNKIKFPEYKFYTIDFNKNNFNKNISSDIALVLQTLEHINNPIEFINNLKKVTKTIIITIPLEETPEGEHYWTFILDDFIKISKKCYKYNNNNAIIII